VPAAFIFLNRRSIPRNIKERAEERERTEINKPLLLLLFLDNVRLDCYKAHPLLLAPTCSYLVLMNRSLFASSFFFLLSFVLDVERIIDLTLVDWSIRDLISLFTRDVLLVLLRHHVSQLFRLATVSIH
jgi:hypothetical protein